MRNLIHAGLSAILFTFAVVFCAPAVRGQLLVTPGSHVVVASGTTVTSLDNVTVNNGGFLDVSGNLVLKKNLTNQNSLQPGLGNGTFRFTGTLPQIVAGAAILQNLTVGNSAGLTVQDGITVNGVLTLDAGLVSLGAAHLQLGPAASVGGSPSAAAMVVPTGTGELRKEFPGYTSFTFPVGDNTGTAEYSPVTLTYADGGFPSGNYASVRLSNSKYPDPNITGNYLNRYWTLGVNGLETGSMSAVFTYVPADVTGNEAVLQCARVYPQPWSVFAPANTALHQLTATSFYSYGAFTGVKSATPPFSTEVTNVTLGNGVSTCYDATNQITVAGGGTTFTVNTGGSATFVAGQRISFQPGVTVFPGGYLHGYISTNGVYCTSPVKAAAIAGAAPDGQTSVPEAGKDARVRVFPNPTFGDVTVDLTKVDPGVRVEISLYGMSGSYLFSKTTEGGISEAIPMATLPAGIYLVHIRFGSNSEVFKVVKR